MVWRETGEGGRQGLHHLVLCSYGKEFRFHSSAMGYPQVNQGNAMIDLHIKMINAAPFRD